MEDEQRGGGVGRPIAYLIKVAVVTPLHSIRNVFAGERARLQPEPRIVTGGIIVVPKIKVMITSFRLPQDLVLFEGERRRIVKVSFEADEVAQANEGISLVHGHGVGWSWTHVAMVLSITMYMPYRCMASMASRHS